MSKNIINEKDDYCEVILNHDKKSTIDKMDKNLILQYSWHSRLMGHNWYAFHKSKINTSMHRLILNAPKGSIVDHINGDSLDNRRANLRICSHAENMRNSKHRSHSQYKYKGIRKSPEGKWGAKFNKTTVGYFDSEELAAKIYDIHAIKYFGEFAKTNFLLTEQEQQNLWLIFTQYKQSHIGSGLHLRKDTGRWQAIAKVGIKAYKRLGCFSTKEEAQQAIINFKIEQDTKEGGESAK